MISGFNTDIRHGDIVFHVQTEDKGTSNPFIESLVYVGGQVLAAKRASYAKLLEEGQGTKAISEMMETQHRTVLASIRQGKLDKKVEALPGKAAHGTGGHGTGGHGTEGHGTGPVPVVQDDLLSSTRITEGDRTLDQVILEYLTNEAEQEQLRLVVDGEPDLTAGLRSQVRLKASSSKSGDPVTGALVDVKLISTVAEARILASGETRADGGVELSFLIPDLGGGAAALIFTAESAIGSAELKHLL